VSLCIITAIMKLEFNERSEEIIQNWPQLF
jgi:hypothetical protein